MLLPIHKLVAYSNTEMVSHTSVWINISNSFFLGDIFSVVRSLFAECYIWLFWFIGSYSIWDKPAWTNWPVFSQSRRWFPTAWRGIRCLPSDRKRFSLLELDSKRFNSAAIGCSKNCCQQLLSLHDCCQLLLRCVTEKKTPPLP